MAWYYGPCATWHVDVQHYLSAALGPDKFSRVSTALCRPPLKQTVRINTLHHGFAGAGSLQLQADVSQRLQQQLGLAERPKPHPTLPATLMLQGSGPAAIDYSPCEGREVVINRYAGESVLRGAHVYCPGLLATSPRLAEGDLVGVSVAVERPGSNWCGISRGTILPSHGTPASASASGTGLPPRTSLFLGTGRCAAGRRVLFRNQSGIAVQMVQRVFESPSLNGVLPGQIMLQALPSITTAHVLAPAPGSRVLDMCSAPGGKTTLLAELMQDRGEVWALDRTHAKVAEVQSLAASFGLRSIRAVKADATCAVQGWSAATATDAVRADAGGGMLRPSVEDKGVAKKADEGCAFAGFPPESFDHVLLDPPCSALGLRPRLVHAWTLQQLLQVADYQRALLHAAVALLKPGGTLVYSTCTINPAENEGNVRYALDRWGPSAGLGGCQLELVPAEPLIGGQGLCGPALELSPTLAQRHGWLSPAEAGMVQRFDPDDREGGDTIGFFVAKFRKGGSWPGNTG